MQKTQQPENPAEDRTPKQTETASLANNCFLFALLKIQSNSSSRATAKLLFKIFRIIYPVLACSDTNMLLCPFVSADANLSLKPLAERVGTRSSQVRCRRPQCRCSWNEVGQIPVLLFICSHGTLPAGEGLC